VLLLPGFLALVIAALLAVYLPVWASVSIALTAVVAVAIGGGALLAKATIAGAVFGVGVWLSLRYLRQRRIERITRDMNWVDIANAKTTQNPRAVQRKSQQRDTERRAA
jgi:hypothetical protein